ncbi:iron ABC transporter permease [Calidifontibacter sp. DB0510]|uniref:Iron ABC transporter permease n=1 Tax=Metallococcus carri TaxID=1656884 RepID=A0A967B258_9MICO|nr:iron ABC transporter permease [Metallococcus carri]NHN56602.1 iron ABC transporter permease [Metallococcus carri]NOP38901.1 iron ABC transporter permease [Calidifontibacter sp. DB2511S]
MTLTHAVPVVQPSRARHRLLGALLGLGIVAALGIAHLAQGTTGAHVLWDALAGDPSARALVLDGRLPRLAAALVVGICLGMAGCVLQSITRNPLASPDTLAVNAGAALTLAVGAIVGWPVAGFAGMGLAFVGGLAAAAIALLAAGDRSPVRLVLAGSVLTLGLSSVTGMLILLDSQRTQGLFAWGAGSLDQSGMAGVLQPVPLVLVGVVLLLALAPRLDLLGLGDDAAASLGVPVGRTKGALVVVAVLLSAVAVTLCGPLGFVGLCAPVAVTGLARRYPGLRPHRVRVPASGLAGAAVVIVADLVVRATLGAQAAVDIPTGVVTTIVGAVVLIGLSRGMRSGRSDVGATGMGRTLERTARHPRLVVAVTAAALAAAIPGALLLGDGLLLGGDLVNWVRGVAPGSVSFVVESRLPRVVAAVTAGVALAVAGTLVQAVSRNPLADPGLLGVSSGAGLGAILALVGGPLVGFTAGSGAVLLGALTGAAASAVVIVFACARSGFDPTRVVLVGLGVQAGTTALTTFLIARTDPSDQSRALTWLGGSTYGASLAGALVVGVIAVAGLAAGVWAHHRLDLIQLDADTPALLGVSTMRVRAGAIVVSVVLVAAATSVVGVVGFVGLVAPHLARVLLGARHRGLLVLAALLGGLLALVADTVGRAVLAPVQLPMGLVCALIGTPVFARLLIATRGDR